MDFQLNDALVFYSEFTIVMDHTYVYSFIKNNKKKLSRVIFYIIQLKISIPDKLHYIRNKITSKQQEQKIKVYDLLMLLF